MTAGKGRPADDDVLPGGFPALVGDADEPAEDGAGLDGVMDGADAGSAADADMEGAEDDVMALEDLLDPHAAEREMGDGAGDPDTDLETDGDDELGEDDVQGERPRARRSDDDADWSEEDDDGEDDSLAVPGVVDGEGAEEDGDDDSDDDDAAPDLPMLPSLDAEGALAEDLDLDDDGRIDF